MRVVLSIVATLGFSLSATASDDVIKYAMFDQWSKVKISPDGEYIGAITRENGRKKLVTFKTENLEPLNTIIYAKENVAVDFDWVANDRIATRRLYRSKTLMNRIYTQIDDNGETKYRVYYTVNADGSAPTFAVGSRKETNVYKTNWGQMVDPMLSDKDFMLVSGTTMDKSAKEPSALYKIHIENGTIYKVFDTPIKYPRFFSDGDDKVNLAFGLGQSFDNALYTYHNQSWQPVDFINANAVDFKPLQLQPNSNKLYALYNHGGGPKGLYLFNLDDGSSERLYQHPTVSVDKVMFDRQGKAYALTYDDGLPKTHIIDSENEDAKSLAEVLASLPGYQLRVVSETGDARLKVILASNQYNPGDYLLLDVKQNKLTHLFKKRSWVDPANIAKMVPYQFKSRDGLDIAGYITLPRGVNSLDDAKNAPFIVNVHGGPHGVRSYMKYNSENQLYASKGIGVLQVNYRGSSGYGSRFSQQGYRRWSDGVQYDIIDAIRDLVDQGIADKNRLCIVGASFGAYAAMQSSIIEPDLFKCAVGINGIYDLTLLYKIGDVSDHEVGKRELNASIGNDIEALKAASPAHNAARIKTQVLLIHGEDDKQAPLEHAQLLNKNLKEQGNNHEYIVIEEAGHNLDQPQHRAEVLSRTLSFLTQQLAITP